MTNHTLSTRSVVVVSPDQVSSDLAGETVLLSMIDAHYYGFAGVGSRIWELVTEPIAVSAVCAVITEEFDVAREHCEADVLRFVRELVAKGLLEVRDGA